ncbi:MAG: hypothetical protein V4693_09800 [Pseudomonadota bacterium]
MQKLIEELNRLYLPASPPEGLRQHVLGADTLPVSLASGDGLTRAMVIPFRKMADGDGLQHWSLLCEVANAVQTQLGLPAPAVSISGADGYGLWLSLETAAPADRVQQFLELLHRAYFPDMELRADAATAPVELPPCLHAGTGKWAAFINPGLGASFADEAGLEMAPPSAGQCALLEGVQSISEAQFARAIGMLQQSHGVATPAAAETARPSSSGGLLLKDATLEDIVRHLHSKNIEPTFRHLIP